MSSRHTTLDEASAYFCTSTGEGLLRVRWCEQCRAHRDPCAETCHVCLTLMDPDFVSGRGHVIAIGADEHAWPEAPGLASTEVVVALTDALDVRLTGVMVDADPFDVTVGRAVIVRFERRGRNWRTVLVPDRASRHAHAGQSLLLTAPR